MISPVVPLHLQTFPCIGFTSCAGFGYHWVISIVLYASYIAIPAAESLARLFEPVRPAEWSDGRKAFDSLFHKWLCSHEAKSRSPMLGFNFTLTVYTPPSFLAPRTSFDNGFRLAATKEARPFPFNDRRGHPIFESHEG
jgi:hypothetical protein